jgi:fumarate hydratase class I
MDKFTRPLLEKTGLIGMIGKAERGAEAIAAIKEFGAVYLIAIGGAAYLVAKAIKASRLIAFPELRMEAIREFTVVDMPVTVAVDSSGESLHINGPATWKTIIANFVKE